MTQTVRRRKRNGNVQQQEWGVKAALADRRRAVWALRARGFSYRGIAEQLNLSHPSVAWNDCQRAEDEWGSIVDDPEVVRQQLLAVHTQVVGSLMQCLERQAQQGQVTEARDADGQTTGYQVRHWISPQSAAEVGRSLQRIAALFGLGNATDPDQAAAATSSTNIVLIQPGDGASFSARAQQLAEARQAEPAAIDVSVAEETGENPPVGLDPASTPPEAPQDEADLDAALAQIAAERAARVNAVLRRRGAAREAIDPPSAVEAPTRARRGQSERPAVRFLDPPQRN
jgi:hypothetical protein